MAAFPDGVPCWAEATVPDLEAAKRFYGEVLGWTFDISPEAGGCTEAKSDGLRVAALVPTPAGTAGAPPRWNVHFASSRVDETARRIEAAGGRAAVAPGDVAGLGRTVIAQDPEGTFFGVRQAGGRNFEKQGAPGSYVWADICVRDTASADAFYQQVLPLKAVPLEERGTEADYQVLKVGDHAVAGRLRMDDQFPADVPPHVIAYFAVDDCDRAVGIVRRLGGELMSGPTDSRFGRFAVVRDQQGTVFAVLDPATTAGEPPE